MARLWPWRARSAFACAAGVPKRAVARHCPFLESSVCTHMCVVVNKVWASTLILPGAGTVAVVPLVHGSGGHGVYTPWKRGAADSLGVAVKRGWRCGRFDAVMRRCRAGRTATSTWSFGRRSGLRRLLGGWRLSPLFLPFFPLLPLSWSWREVVATGVVAERMEGARAPQVAPTCRGRRSWESERW
jgi:hypothetical protein